MKPPNRITINFPKADDLDWISAFAAGFDVSKITRQFINEVCQLEEKVFTTYLRTNAKPLIKGEITRGKLQWRGIRLIRQNIGFSSCSWLEQRGKPISPKLHIVVKIG